QCGDVTSTISPSRTSTRFAVSGCSSTQDCQVILVTGSGFSSSHGLLLPRPSWYWLVGYGRKRNSPSPSKLVSPGARSAAPAESAGAGAGAAGSYTPP